MMNTANEEILMQDSFLDSTGPFHYKHIRYIIFQPLTSSS